MTDLGTDISTIPDLDPNFTSISGTRVVAEAVARRWTTPRGALFYAPNYGFDVRAKLNARNVPGALNSLSAQLENEALQDERVQSANVTVSFVANKLSIKAKIGTSTGSLQLVLTVDQYSKQLEVA